MAAYRVHAFHAEADKDAPQRDQVQRHEQMNVIEGEHLQDPIEYAGAWRTGHVHAIPRLHYGIPAVAAAGPCRAVAKPALTYTSGRDF